jgi:hypothetical protein
MMLVIQNDAQKEFRSESKISDLKSFLHPHRLVRSRTPDFHFGNWGSNPHGDAQASQPRENANFHPTLSRKFRLDCAQIVPVAPL